MAHHRDDDELNLASDMIVAVSEQLDVITQLVSDAEERDRLLGGVTDHLEALWEALQQTSDVDVFVEHRVIPKLRDTLARCEDYIKLHSDKQSLQRLVASRSAAESARLFHEEIDAFYRLLGRNDAPAWRARWEKDSVGQQMHIGGIVAFEDEDVVLDLTDKQLNEVLYNFQYEVEKKRESHSPEHLERLERTLALVLNTRGLDTAPVLPSWYIPSYDVLCSEAFAFGSFAILKRGTWEGKRVVVKRLVGNDATVKNAFAREREVWEPLDHENVIRLFGACHVSETLFFVCEDATGGNFRNYFKITKRGLWRLFHQAACGLLYLHDTHSIVHGDLKCNNLLVGADGVAKISNFGYSYVRQSSVDFSVLPQTPVAAWKAPECMGGEGSAFKPRYESDAYSLAMCIIEAMTGETPWGSDTMALESSENGILERLKANGGYPRPDSVFTDEEWTLVDTMSRAEYTARISLDEAIEALEQLATTEEKIATPVHAEQREHLSARALPDKEDPLQDIDARLLSGSFTAVTETLERVEKLTQRMHESESLVKWLFVRLQFLHSALKTSNASELNEHSKLVARFGTVVKDVLGFLKKFSKKKALQRIAASRLIREGVRRLHSSIDIVFQDAGLADAPEMSEWKEHEAANVAKQRKRLEKLETSGAIIRRLSSDEVEEAVLEIRFEIERHNNPKEFVALLKRVLVNPDVINYVIDWEVKDWFVRRDDIEMEDNSMGKGSSGEAFKGKRGAEGAKVCVKVLFVDGPDAQEELYKEARIWHKLSHPNVLKSFGSCHVGSPMFLVSELANAGNFNGYLNKRENKGRLWELFHQAAQGLAYLHSERVVHADIKCSNLLVGDDGLAKVCDFGFSNIKMHLIGKNSKEQLKSVRWKAPECLTERGPAGEPTFASDVFSLGMSIIEAKTGNVPWGMKSDDEIFTTILDSNCYPRPDGDIFTDREWELVSGLTAFDPKQRWSLDRALEVMRELKTSQEREEDAVKTTPRNLDKVRVSTRVLPATEVMIGDATHGLPSAESKSSNPPTVQASFQAGYNDDQSVTVLEADTLSQALGESGDRQDAAIVAIERNMEQMCLEKRENCQVLRLLVTALVRAAHSAADGKLQRTTYVSSVLDEVYRQLLGMLQQHSFSTNIFCRIASNWHFLSEVESLRQRLATLGRLVYSAENESSDWSSSWDACLAIRDAQLHSQLEDARNLSEILPDQSAREEALTLLKFEVEQSASASTSALVLAAFEKVSTWCGSDEDVSVPGWFIPGYEVQYDEAMLEGEGTFGSVYIGVWRNDRRGSPGEKSVAVKVLLVHGLGGGYSHRSFVRSLDLWYAHQEHPNVLKLYGASHIGQRAFLVLENADQGNLLKFIAKRGVEGAERWQLLLQVAKGLAYLHENKVVHGHLRCANILVSGSGVVKIADFGFDGVRSAVHALGHFETPRTLPWTAPELMLSSDGTPSFESDVYAFGMCIIEAVTGDVPWGTALDDEIIEAIRDGNIFTRPDGLFAEREWELVEGMTALDSTKRWSLDQAIDAMNGLETRRLEDPVKTLVDSSVVPPPDPVPTSLSSLSRSSSTSVEMSHSSSALSTSDDAAFETQGEEELTDAVTSSLLVSTKPRRITPFPALDEPSESDAKQTRSLTLQQDLYQRRNSFSAMTADSRAQLRRRSHDFADYASITMPPPHSNTGFPHARSKNHVHARMYGKADTVAGKSVSARQEEGAPLVDVLSPKSRTTWCRGQPVTIEWTALDADVESVKIELLEEGSSATTMITRATPNTGSFWYPKVPWGMQSGPTYFLRVSSVADPARYMTTGFFSIGSAF